ncbi:hypothetical protein IKF88_00310 [Candidatus Saccharibacteria bacterium]|nr:hypothetical protein [Candidatus Saccharibacteria bacterium]
MSFFVSVIILVLAMLIQASMQLAPGTFALFYHYALGKNSRTKADNLSLYFTLGIITFMATIWLFVYTFIFGFFCDKAELCLNFVPWLMVGVLLAESIASLFFYYRKGKFTALYVPRLAAKNLDLHAQKVKNRSDAFVLGLFSGSLELIFTLPLYVVSVIELMKINFSFRPLFIILYIIVSIIPLFAMRTLYRHDYNLATIEQLRVRTKTSTRIFISVGFLLLAIAITYVGVFYHG